MQIFTKMIHADSTWNQCTFLFTCRNIQSVPIELQHQGRVHFFRTSMVTVTTSGEVIELIGHFQSVDS
uniref:Uncharacterized protein n=1 Tax=Trichogramma kaykai TaxID=54128 RepID=A0ABD2W4E1_9HYME